MFYDRQFRVFPMRSGVVAVPADRARDVERKNNRILWVSFLGSLSLFTKQWTQKSNIEHCSFATTTAFLFRAVRFRIVSDN
jgi:hypothetical protein